MSKQFYTLKVAEKVQETPDTVSLVLEVPHNLQDVFTYKQGQYLTLRFFINDQEERRAYSMSSSPLESHLVVTVKQVRGGKVSNHIAEQVQAGDMIEVMPPEGRFYTQLDADQQKTYYLFGAGSGITPLMSILKTILEVEPQNTVYLFYGNRHEDSIIFKQQLDQLQRRYAGQLFVEYILSQPKKEKQAGLGGFFKKAKMSWQGKVGRIDASTLGDFLQKHPLRARTAEYFVCGPGRMIDTVEAFLLEQGVDKKYIHSERFVSANDSKPPVAKGVAGATLAATIEGKTVETTIPEGKTVLDVLITEKHNPPYSCTSGACSSCMAKVLEGTVKMDACYALDDDEIAEGFILTCQAHPTSAHLAITYDV